MSCSPFDVAIVGAGPGGYVAAIRAAQNGMKVAICDERKRPGGTCLNVGCIPSKTLLHATELGVTNQNHANQWRAAAQQSARLDMSKLQKTRESTINQLSTGINFLFKKNKTITPIMGARATVTSPTSLKIGADKEIKAKNIIIATGSTPSEIRGGFLKIDEKEILSSTGALELKEVPKKLLVVGGGVIGLEIAQIYNRLGSKVEIIEFLPHIGGVMDQSVAIALKKILEKQGIKIHVNVGVTGHSHTGSEHKLIAKTNSSSPGKEKTLEFVGDKVLVAVGRRPVTENLGLEAQGVKIDKFGRVEVDEYLQTHVPSIHAIGDCVAGPMLAHKAEEDAMTVVANLLGHKEKADYSCIPGVIYCNPEVAMVGKTEQELKAAGVKYKAATFPMMANSRSKCHGTADGLVKIIAGADDKILGATIISENAGEMITELVMALKFNVTAKQVGHLVHPHPTISEAVKEACMAVSWKPIHM